MALYHKWDVKNGFAYALTFFSLISDSLGGVYHDSKNYRLKNAVPNIGCIHGHCNDQAFECICHDDQRWQGDHCDEPICKEGCLHGYCQSPQQCM